MIYLDHAAATPVSAKVQAAMAPYLSDDFFNPSAPYLPAKHVREAYESAKNTLAHTIGAKGADLIITASATESINLAFTALSSPRSKVLYLATEHPAVRNTAAPFPHAEIPVTRTGLIDLPAFKAQLTPDVELVSVALVSSELGVIQPLAKIAEIINQERAARRRQHNPTPLFLHSDASQALGLLEVSVARLGVDLLTLNAAKIYGPKGIGALYANHKVKLTPLTRGGGQEMGLRSGTENVPALIGFAAAAVEAKNHLHANRKKYHKYNQIFRQTLLDAGLTPTFLGHPKHQLATFCPLTFLGQDAEKLIFQLEEKDIYVSTGAACAAAKLQKSPALQAIGLSDAEIKGSLRITMGELNTENQIKQAAATFASLILANQQGQNQNANNHPAKKSSVSAGLNATTRSIPNATTQPANQNIKISTPKTVFLGMSGGVDSAVSALLLKQQGYRVVGAYMKNWSKDLPGHHCPWAEDLADAKRVATKLQIDFQIFDFEKDYKQKVVDYMLAEFKQGRTPNPDIMCNQEIKFKLFYEVAKAQGADFIATGHYARTTPDNRTAPTPDNHAAPALNHHVASAPDGQIAPNGPAAAENTALLRAVDNNKDQTYFLYRIAPDALRHTLFPIGHLLKSQVKQLAAKHHLHLAHKKESMGVCFIGEVNLKDFLQQYLTTTPGPILDADTRQELGTHEGAILYTIGQRRGLNLGGGLPYYVVDKDIAKNIVYVSRNLNHQSFWVSSLPLKDIFLRPHPGVHPKDLRVRLRHRGELLPAQLKGSTLTFAAPVKKPAPGQSAVLYGGEDYQICLGGGIIA